MRAARVLLGWTRADLADRAALPGERPKLKTLEAFERGDTASPLLVTASKWRAALERAGVVFIPADDTGGVGVRLATPRHTGDEAAYAKPRAAKRRAKAPRPKRKG